MLVKLLGIEPRSLGWKPSVLPLYYSSLWRPWQESNLLHAVLEAAALPLSYKAVCVWSPQPESNWPPELRRLGAQPCVVADILYYQAESNCLPRRIRSGA